MRQAAYCVSLAGVVGPIIINKIVGPVTQISANTFALRLDRNAETQDRRLLDIWLWASHPGDTRYKSIVQQAVMHVQPNIDGTDQHITFPAIPDQKAEVVGQSDTNSVKLGPLRTLDGRSTIMCVRSR